MSPQVHSCRAQKAREVASEGSPGCETMILGWPEEASLDRLHSLQASQGYALA